MRAHGAVTAIEPLADFQTAFAEALFDPQSPALAALTAQPGFAVYRNTVFKGCVDALQANYPAVARLVGDDWFRAAAAIYVQQSPPTDPTLLNYGASFADFLKHFEPAAALTYLPGVATLDRLWREAHTARDEAALDPAALTTLSPSALAAAVLYTQAAARWVWFADAPVFSIWSRNRVATSAPDEPWEPEWQAEGALLTRIDGAVQWQALDAAGFAFVDTCANGATLAQASAAALAAQPDVDLQHLMAKLLRAQVLSRISITRYDKNKLFKIK